MHPEPNPCPKPAPNQTSKPASDLMLRDNLGREEDAAMNDGAHIRKTKAVLRDNLGREEDA